LLPSYIPVWQKEIPKKKPSNQALALSGSTVSVEAKTSAGTKVPTEGALYD
jgi:hypothetical protein